MKDRIIIGKFGKTHGLDGWLRVISFTDPKKNILKLTPWIVQEKTITPEDSKLHGKNILVKLPDCNDVSTVKTYTNLEIEILAKQLPKLKKDHYYWAELEGLTVFTKDQQELGVVDNLIATGGNDVLVIKGTRIHFVPYLSETIIKVDLAKKTIIVDWDENF